MPVDYYKHKELGLCVKCSNEATNGLYCYRHRLTAVYGNIHHRCLNKYNNNRNNSYANIQVEFTCNEFIKWGLKNRPLGLKTPSIGRINHNLNYSLDNIMWQEFDSNRRQQGGQKNVAIGYYRCPDCHVVFERTTAFFYRNAADSDGLGAQCKDCDNLRRKEYNRRR